MKRSPVVRQRYWLNCAINGVVSLKPASKPLKPAMALDVLKSMEILLPAIACPYSALIAAIPWMAGLLVNAPMSNLVTSPVLLLYWITGEK